MSSAVHTSYSCGLSTSQDTLTTRGWAGVTYMPKTKNSAGWDITTVNHIIEINKKTSRTQIYELHCTYVQWENGSSGIDQLENLVRLNDLNLCVRRLHIVCGNICKALVMENKRFLSFREDVADDVRLVTFPLEAAIVITPR